MMKPIVKFTAFMLAILLLATTAVVTKALVHYYALFETPFTHIEMKYHLYALIYVLQFVIFIVVGVLTLKLFFKVYKDFNFSETCYDIIIGIAMGLFIYGTLPSFRPLISIKDSYADVLNTSDLSHSLIIIIGIAILVLGIVYKKSQKIKEEQDLTI